MQNVKSILEDAGWFPQRKVEIEDMVKEYETFSLNPPDRNLQKLFKEFWDLTLYFTMPDGQQNDIRLTTDVVPSVSRTYLQKYGEILGDTLVPVGSIYDDTALLIASYSGRFYMLSNSMFFILGNTFYDSLDTIINQKDLLRIN